MTFFIENLQAEAKSFWDRGYLIIRNVFTAEEMQIMKAVIADHKDMNDRVETVRAKISQGKHPSFETIFVWNDTGGQDIFAKLTRNYQILDRLRFIFSDDVYVYHNKITLKYPNISGFRYHQDYAYWYHMGNIFPDMATVSIAIDPATKENGCLRFLEGSHKLGRLDHEYLPEIDDKGVDSARLAILQNNFTEVHAELNAGDIVMFHCNTLHGSDDNNSSQSRIALLGCYNTQHNNPYKVDCGHPCYSHQPSVMDRITTADSDKLPDFKYSYQPS